MRVFYVHSADNFQVAQFASDDDWSLLESASMSDWRGAWRPLVLSWSARSARNSRLPDVTRAANAVLLSDAARVSLESSGLLRGYQFLELRGPDGPWWLVRLPYADNVDVERSEFRMVGVRRGLLASWADGGGRTPLFKVPSLGGPVYCTDDFVEALGSAGIRGLAFAELPQLPPSVR